MPANLKLNRRRAKSARTAFFTAAAGGALFLMVSGAGAQAPNPAQPDLALGMSALAGQWTGEASPPESLPLRWVMIRHDDGRYEATFTAYRSQGETRKSRATGRWSFDGKLLRITTDGQADSEEAFQVSPEAFGCLSMQSVDPGTAQVGPDSYRFMDCPHPSPWPSVTDIACEAKFLMPDGQAQVLKVAVKGRPDGPRQAEINGEAANRDVEVIDHPIRTGFTTSIDPEQALNPGEASLLHLHRMASELGSSPDTKDLAPSVPFDVKDVRMVRVYELVPGSRLDKFGGSVMFEPFDGQGRSLGKGVRAMLIGWCVP